MVYKWRYCNDMNEVVSAQTAGKEMERIEKKHGTITPEILLEESRKQKAVLHNCFEWDDTAAAEKYRLHQSTMMIANIMVIQKGKQDEERTVRAFVNIKNDEGKKGYFVNVVSALSNEQTREIVLNRALSELRAFKAKYDGLSELSEVLAAIEKVA